MQLYNNELLGNGASKRLNIKQKMVYIKAPVTGKLKINPLKLEGQ